LLCWPRRDTALSYDVAVAVGVVPVEATRPAQLGTGQASPQGGLRAVPPTCPQHRSAAVIHGQPRSIQVASKLEDQSGRSGRRVLPKLAVVVLLGALGRKRSTTPDNHSHEGTLSRSSTSLRAGSGVVAPAADKLQADRLPSWEPPPARHSESARQAGGFPRRSNPRHPLGWARKAAPSSLSRPEEAWHAGSDSASAIITEGNQMG
jgi:hypothetical protein